MKEELLNILEELVSFKSITPNDSGCQLYVSKYLQHLGFSVNQKKYGDVDNLIAKKGSSKPVMAFVGHTDVVPAGNLDEWSTNPFVLEEKNGKLLGRGVADMKGSIACIMHAYNNFSKKNKDFNGTLLIILTSDEEGPAVDGIQRLLNEKILKKYDIDFCLVGEPSSKEKLGDTIKNGRRGSLSGEATIKGQQGHIAYPQNANNPIHLASSIINQLISQKYDNGNDFFPPTSFQISNIKSGYGVENIIPGELSFSFNFRYSNETDEASLISSVENIFKKSEVQYNIKWRHSGEPYLTTKKDFLEKCQSSIKEIIGHEASVSTDGGTSDGRFMAKICDQVIELGLLNKSIHKIDEHTTENDLLVLSAIYEKILTKVFKS